ncbi:MAG: serine hydrolase domain-containing protein [Gemmatimonadales bacterium]
MGSKMKPASSVRMSRRGFVAAGAATLGTAVIPGSGIAGRPIRRQARDWIPSADLLAQLPRWMEVASTPGVAVAVVEDGVLAWQGAYGVVDTATRQPVDEQSIFPAASLGKPVFGYAVLALADQGRFDVNRPLVEYARPDDLPDDPRLSRITASHVLSHTSGLRNWRFGDQKLLPDFDPGAQFQYSGEGFYWLSQAIEAVTGQGIDRFMTEQLFAPAGMASASYGWSDEHARQTVSGHSRRGQVGDHYSRSLGAELLPVAARMGKPIRDWRSDDARRALQEVRPKQAALPNSIIPNVAGSLLCTAGDYARFMSLLMPGTPQARWKIAESRRVAMLAKQARLAPTLSWGLGLGLEERGRDQYFWHWGDNGIFRAFMVGDPTSRRAIAVFTNADGGPKIYQRLIRSIGLDLNAFLWV